MPDLYPFRPETCTGCGKSLARAKAPIAGWKGNIPMGYCKCGTASPLDMGEAVTEETEPTGEPEGGPEKETESADK